MLNLRYLFFVMVGLNIILIFFFLNISTKTTTSSQLDKLQNLHTTLLVISDEKTDDVDSMDVIESGKKVQSVNLTKEVSLDEQADEEHEVPTGNGTITNSFETQVSGIPQTKKEKFDELTQKINSDPKLKEFFINFQKLKNFHQKLSKKYNNLEKEHNLLKSTVNGTADSNKSTSSKETMTQKKLDEVNERSKQVQMVMRLSNPLFLLGAYPNVSLEYFNSYPDGRPFYERPNYGLHNDADYCELTDLYNLAHPENMFKRKTFFTDYAKNGLARQDVMRKIGYDLSPKVSKYMPKFMFKTVKCYGFSCLISYIENTPS